MLLLRGMAWHDAWEGPRTTHGTPPVRLGIHRRFGAVPQNHDALGGGRERAKPSVLLDVSGESVSQGSRARFPSRQSEAFGLVSSRVKRPVPCLVAS